MVFNKRDDPLRGHLVEERFVWRITVCLLSWDCPVCSRLR